MIHHQNTFTLINEQSGALAFKLFSFDDATPFSEVQRHNYFTLIWATEGSGEMRSDFSTHAFVENSVMAFTPYQPFMLSSAREIKGYALQFHSDFFCILKHHQEVSCNGMLFNNVYDPPITVLDEGAKSNLMVVLHQMKEEMQTPELAQHELLISYLKIFLITVTRLKARQVSRTAAPPSIKEPFVLQKLKDAIELHYRKKHAPSEYAELLHITPKALAKITKQHFNKTLTDLITERIIIEAKRELYLTNKPIKEIASELGYEDEHYFSRFFKNNAEVSPQLYRETVGFGRGEN